MRNKISILLAVGVFLFSASGQRARADEGIWLFNDFPSAKVKAKYGVDVTRSFLDHLRLASTRIYPYGSGSFVSPNGLVFTNHHVASDCIQKVSTAKHNYMRDGFYAATTQEEKACPDLEVNVLIRIKDVTKEVKGAVPEQASPAEANRSRKAAMAKIEKACMDAGGDRCDVESMYSGGRYYLYQYKKYTDVRLVFAPEEAIAAFGGDPDNFTYPRYCLDFAFFRVWENGKPATTKQYLRFNPAGVQEGELTFVSGHPGSTGRLLTYAALKFNRDVAYPLTLSRIRSLVEVLLAFSSQSPEHKRVARDNLLMQQNSFKAFTGFLRGLRDPKLMRRKLAEENKLRKAVEADPKLRREFGGIWDEIAAGYAEFRKFYKPYYLFERNATRGSRLLSIARHILRYTEETAKPNEKRLREYSESALPSLKQRMFSPAPISKAMEKVVLADYFRFLVKELGADDPVVKAVLNGRTPVKAAASYVDASRIENVTERKRLAASAETVRESDDGMIRLARILDTPARRLRKRYEDKVQAVIRAGAGKVAKARFAVHGPGDYPDATFTLRLSYGPVKGYRNAEGKPVPFTTKFGGVYRRATGVEPFRLPPSWIKAKKILNMETQFDFVTTNDTHGGNSGSPTVNTKGEVVGILFDGNLESLPNRFVYTDERARSVHVAVQGIVEALRKVYHADELLKELGVKQTTSADE